MTKGDEDVPPEERAKAKAKYDQWLIGIQAKQQADEINRAKKLKISMVSHDEYWGVKRGATIPGYTTGDDTRGQNGDD